ncbi:MAG: hypothetical protein KDI88_00135 [Gammaproteobacteria bacterium]|nr:hypothetical protein [Gammaproteobacteria bacterium]
MSSDPIYHRLQQIIGDRFHYLDEIWILIEVLSDVDSLVLQRCKDCQPHHVQQNLYGMPNRRTMETLTLRISDVHGNYSEDVMVLLEGHQRGAR